MENIGKFFFSRVLYKPVDIYIFLCRGDIQNTIQGYMLTHNGNETTSVYI